MRSWKVRHKEDRHWVSFHFKQSCDELLWVTVVGKATIFLALCLHSAVDELLWQCNNKPIRKPSENDERRVGVLGKGLGKSLSTSTGRGSIGEEPPAERSGGE